jgi:MoxR-like ATPase
MEEYFNFQKNQSIPQDELQVIPDTDHQEVKDFIHNTSYSLKPKELFIDELRWKYAVRSVIRSQNVLIVGPTGSGKTMMVKWLSQSMDRPLHIFNLGATQDPRSTLIGNTHFNKDEGTFFNQSPFVQAIQTPNSIILLDELSRANPEAFNILMSVLDPNQRYLRLDESEDAEIIQVDPTVTFIGTANVGTEYTSTRVIDRALQDRFVTIKMDYLNREQEHNLIGTLFPTLSVGDVNGVVDVVQLIRSDVDSTEGQLERNLSTRHSIEMASLINDGFTIDEVLEIVVYPNYDNEGGMDSELTYVKQLIQSKMDDSEGNPMENIDENTSPF